MSWYHLQRWDDTCFTESQFPTNTKIPLWPKTDCWYNCWRELWGLRCDVVLNRIYEVFFRYERATNFSMSVCLTHVEVSLYAIITKSYSQLSCSAIIKDWNSFVLYPEILHACNQYLVGYPTLLTIDRNYFAIPCQHSASLHSDCFLYRYAKVYHCYQNEFYCTDFLSYITNFILLIGFSIYANQ